MKVAFICLALVLVSACAWAQAPAPATAPPPAHGMAAMHEQHLQEMKDQVAKMRATLDQMRANLSKVKDPADRKQEEMNVELWDSMIKHMEGMVEMMSSHHPPMGDMGGGMHHGEMACGKEHHGDHDAGCCAMMKAGGSCCADMAGMKDGGCCGGNKCGGKSDADLK